MVRELDSIVKEPVFIKVPTPRAYNVIKETVGNVQKNKTLIKNRSAFYIVFGSILYINMLFRQEPKF